MRWLKQRYVRRFGVGFSSTTLLVVIIMACGDITITGPNSGTSHRCVVIGGPGWPTNGFFTISKPANCPLKLGGLTNVDYAATGVWPLGTTNRLYQLSITNRLGSTVGAFVNSPWTVTGTDEMVAVTGNYLAATGLFDAGNHGFDNANNQIFTPTGWKVATGTITYDFGMPGLTMLGIDSIGAGVPYTVEAFVNDANFIPPVSWEWRINGTLQSTAAGPFTGTLTSPGQVHTVTARALDGNGVVHVKSHDVTACGGSAINC